MLFHAVSSIAVLALAGQAIAEPLRQPYQLKFARMSPREIFGLDRRSDGGYSPEQQFCDSGKTCADACGKGFEQCASNDGVVHCFNKTAKQTCCPGKTGDSCDDGYFCTADERGATWCCPDNMTLKECAAAYSLPGSLTAATPSSTSTTKSPSLTHISTESATVVKITQSTTITWDYVSHTTEAPMPPPTNTNPVPATTSATTSANTSATASATSSPSPTAPANGLVEAGSDSIHAPMSGMVLLVAAAFAIVL
ncbi:hypothetical protein F5Y13DRAFT_169687 [Hypoxylon sp. FL1857]|nr:hypothetical protein F5Y13DRAFT_169687 [Hypoxylon sp. FL1857]